MDCLNKYRDIIEATLLPYTQLKYAWGDIACSATFDRRRDSYVLISHGWRNRQRTHYCLAHIEIREGKVWIQEDGLEHGLATELEAAGIPSHDLVLGFQPADVRHLTEYAAA